MLWKLEALGDRLSLPHVLSIMMLPLHAHKHSRRPAGLVYLMVYNQFSLHLVLLLDPRPFRYDLMLEEKKNVNIAFNPH